MEKTFVEMPQGTQWHADGIYVDKWHDEYKGARKSHECLGMTKTQHDRWIDGQDSIRTMTSKSRTETKETTRCQKQPDRMAKGRPTSRGEE